MSEANRDDSNRHGPTQDDSNQDGPTQDDSTHKSPRAELPIDEVPIRDASIRLGQLLKLAGVADHGAMARELIEAGAVKVDGATETRRGAQIRPGQLVQVHAPELGLDTPLQLRSVPADLER